MSSIEKPVPPPIGVPFDEKATLSAILARDREAFMRKGGETTEIPPQNYTPRDKIARPGVGGGIPALDQYVLSSEH